MKIIPKKELTFSNSNVYILESTANHFFINKNEQGLLILDKDINEISSIKINQSISIYSALYSDDGNEILLFCPDNELLLYCDVLSNKAIPINISILKGSCLSPIYQWDNNNILLSTYDKHFYHLNRTTYQLKEVSLTLVVQHHLHFYNFWQIVEKHGFGYQINSLQQSFIYKDEASDNIIYFDYKHNKKTTIQDQSTGYHDIIFSNGYFIFVAEEGLTIVKNEDLYHYPIQDPSYAFQRARFMIEGNTTYIIILTINESGYAINKITKYELLN